MPSSSTTNMYNNNTWGVSMSLPFLYVFPTGHNSNGNNDNNDATANSVLTLKMSPPPQPAAKIQQSIESCLSTFRHSH